MADELPVTTPSDYFLQQRDQADQAVKQAALLASQPLTKTPDEYAQAAKLAKTVNLPTAVIEPQYKTFAQKMTEKRNEIILSTAPNLTQWIAKDDNYKIAADDVEGLSWWENLALVPRAIASSAYSFGQGTYGLLGAATALGGKNAISDWFQGQAKAAEQNAKYVAGPAGGWFGQQVQGASQSIGLMAPGLLASAATGGTAAPGVAAAYILPGALTQAGQSAQKAMDAGKTPAEALRYGLIDGAAEALFEKLPVGRLLGDINQGTGFGKMLWHQISTEVPTEVATTLFQNFNEYATLTPNKSFTDFLREQPAAVRDTVAQTVLATVGLTGTVAGARRVIVGSQREQSQANQAEARKSVFEAISGQAQDSALRARMPEKFREFVDQVTADGPIENVYVPAQDFVQYFQSQGVDPWDLAESELDGVSRDDLDAALAGGGDLRIPTATYAAKIAGSEADPFFMENMRFSPDEMTAREAAEFNARSADAMQEAWAEAERIRTEEETLRGAEDRIYTEMQSRLRQAGRSTDVANTEAMLYPAFYRTMAERSGMTTDEFLAKYPLPQVQGAIPQGMQTKDVGEFNRMLAEVRSRRPTKENRGQSLLEFISERGGINDPGGELRARDAEVVKRGKGKKNLRLKRDASGDGQGSMLAGGQAGISYSADDVAHAVVEAGFMADNPTVQEYLAATREGRQTPDLTAALWDAIDNELRGTPEYATRPDAARVEHEQSLDDLEAYLHSIDVSLNDSDAAILAAVRQDEQAKRYAQGEPLGDISDDDLLAALTSGSADTSSPAFKKWFGDSKVVDDDGNPQVVYHNSHMDFDTFDRMASANRFGLSFNNLGLWFSSRSDKQGGAGMYGPKQYPVYLSMQKPFVIHGHETREMAFAGGSDAAFRKFWKLYDKLTDDASSPTHHKSGRPIRDEQRLALRDPEPMRQWLKENGYDGLIIRNTFGDTPSTEARGQDMFIVLEPEQVKSVENVGTFDPNDARFLFQDTGNGPRGSFQIPVDGIGNGESIIRLSERADLSTFLHETGHYFLSVMQDVAGTDTAVAEEFSSVKAWWRENAGEVAKDARRAFPELAVTAEHVEAAIDNGTSGNVEIDKAIDVGMQEQFARGFETYAMEGKAPSAELRGAFERFRAWLLSVYRKLSGLNVNVSDDLRRVFDRMLAGDEQIANAQADAGGSAPLFATAEQMGLTDEEFARFQKLRAQAEDQAKAKMLAETMAPIKRERERWYKEERANVRDEVEREINSYRQYRAIEWMGNRRWLGEGQPEAMPDMRLSKTVLVERYGEGVLKTLPRGKQTVYTVEGGLDPDEAAGWFGFPSGDEMLRAMEQATPRKEAIEAETDKRMYEKHGDVLSDGTAEEAALAAVHNDRRGEWIAAELEAVRKILGEGPGLTAKEARVVARETISRMKVRDAMAANRFLAAERKAANEAARLGAALSSERYWENRASFMASDEAGRPIPNEKQRDQVAALYAAKRRQLLNHAMYSEARKIGDEVGKAERFVAGLNKASKRERIAGAGRRENAQIDYLSAIDELLDRYDFRRMSATAEDRRGALNDFVAAMTAAGRENELAIPADVLENAQRVPYKTLTVEQLRGVVDSLKNLEHVALRWNDLIDAKNKRELDAVAEGIRDEIMHNLPHRPPSPVKTKGERVRNTVRGYFDLVLNATTLLREIDGFNDAGTAYQAIKAPIDDAQNRLIARKRDVSAALEGLYSVYSKEERRAMAVRSLVPELGYALSKWEKIALALNTGNAGNVDRLTNQRARRAFTEAQITAVLKSLDERDANFVQSVWDYIGSFKADIAARERRTTGVEPKWVEAQPVVIGGKEVKGGYYPIKYDPRLSTDIADREAADIANSLVAGKFGKAQTRNGHIQARAEGSTGSIDLDMIVMHNHINQVIYDLEMSEPVANAWRIVQDNRVRSSLDNAGRSADFDTLQAWLKDAAEGELGPNSAVGAALRGIKSNFTAAKLAFNMGNALLQISGVAQSFVVVGKRDMAVGIMKTAANPFSAAARVADASAFMKSRQTTFNKDIMDFYSDPRQGQGASRWKDFKRNVWGPASFWLMQKVQWHFADVPTWIAGYEQGLRKFGGDEARAVSHADNLVKRSQASGLFIDRTAIERGTLSSRNRQNDVVKLFTTLGSYMFAKFNVAYERSAVAKQVIRDEGVSVRSAVEVASWSLDMVFLFTLEALVGAAIKGQLPGQGDDDDPDNTWLKWLAKNTGFSVMSTLPFIRDGVSALQGHSGGGSYGSVIEDSAKGVTASSRTVASITGGSEDEVKKSDVKNIINATGVATGIPTVFLNRIVDAGWRQSEGENVSPVEYIFGRQGNPKNGK